MRILAFTAWLLAGCLVLCVTSCSTPAGKGRKAEAGYRAAAPVIAALEKFHEAHGHYPADLNELVPTYLPAERLLLHGGLQPVRSPQGSVSAEAWDNSPRFSYNREEDVYGLSFSYLGPGVNDCYYDSRTRKWAAHGYY